MEDRELDAEIAEKELAEARKEIASLRADNERVNWLLRHGGIWGPDGRLYQSRQDIDAFRGEEKDNE